MGKSTKPLPKVPNPPTRCQKTLKYGDKKCVPACVRVCHVYKPGLEQFCHELLRPSAPPFPGPPGWWGGVGALSLVILIYKCALELSTGESYTFGSDNFSKGFGGIFIQFRRIFSMLEAQCLLQSLKTMKECACIKCPVFSADKILMKAVKSHLTTWWRNKRQQIHQMFIYNMENKEQARNL